MKKPPALHLIIQSEPVFSQKDKILSTSTFLSSNKYRRKVRHADAVIIGGFAWVAKINAAVPGQHFQLFHKYLEVVLMHAQSYFLTDKYT